MSTRTSVPAGGDFLLDAPSSETILTPEKLDAEARLMADAAGGYMRGEVLPAADRLQAQEAGLLPALLQQAGALGLLGLEIPEAYGGLGLAKSVSARIAEEIGVEPSFAVSHNVHTSVATLPIVFFGTPEQKDRYLPRLATGKLLGAYALSEAQAGSDALAARTRAIPSADGQSYTLSGEKMWITNAAFADLFVVFAKVEGQKGLTAFLVERGWAGVSIGREEHKLGLKGSSTCRLLLDNVSVSAENVLGKLGEGAKVALYTLNLGRFKIAASSLGQGKNLLGIATRYAKERIAFGKPIGEFGLIGQKLAMMAARLFACEAMLYRVAGYLDAIFQTPLSDSHPSEEYAIECAMLKVACTEVLDYCADECLQIHGGYGYTEEFPAARAWRDARVNRIYEGTNEINRLNVVQLLLRRIEKGRVDLERVRPAEYLTDAEPGTPEAFRAVAVQLVSLVAELFADLPAQQEIAGALADLLIDLFAAESIHLRARRLLESGSAEARWQAAFSAQTVLLPPAIERTRKNVRAVLMELGADGPPVGTIQRMMHLLESPDTSLFAAQRSLSSFVLTSSGYPW